MGLRTKLNQYIKIYGTVGYNEIKRLCETGYFGKYYRMTTAERRLRKSESLDIEEVMKDGYIIAYRHRSPQKYQEAKVLGPDGSVEKTIKLPINLTN